VHIPLPPGPEIDPLELVEGEELVVFRITRTDDPHDETFVESFMSSAALDLPPRHVEVTHPFTREGVSVYDAREAAEATARRYPKIGEYVAQLRLTHDLGVRYLRWGPEGHLTVWCDPIKLASALVDTISVEAEEGA
jgi:hypothetical protein